MSIDFVQPYALTALLLLPPFGLWLRRGDAAHGRRGAICLSLRVVVLALLVLALARPRVVDEVSRLAVAFVVDVSESVPAAHRDEALRRIEADLEEMPEEDRAALIVFGERPSLELPFAGPRARDGGEGMVARLDHLETRVTLTQSDLASAVRFAGGVFPDDFAHRVVLISDGNQTRGDLRGAARALGASGGRLDVRPVRYRFDEEVIVEGVHAPARGRAGEPVQLRVVVSAQSGTEATISLLEGDQVISPPSPVTLERGTNAFLFSPTPAEVGIHQYEVRIDADRDGNPSNNVGRAGVLVGGNPRVLAIASPSYDDRVPGFLDEAGVAVEVGDPGALPRHPAGYVSVDSVVLNNVAAYDLEQEQMEALRDAVTELGVGLVTVGGDRAFGPGGYRGSPLAGLLPVDLDTTNKKTMPKGALVIVLHSVEFDSGNTWAVKICEAAIRALQPTDEVGIVYYSHVDGERWMFPLGEVGDGVSARMAVRSTRVGDMPSFQRCFVLAEESLAASDAAVKHIVIISDGDPQLPDPLLVSRLIADRVTISAFLIEPHGVASVPAVQDLVRRGGGRFRQLHPSKGELAQLPQIMIKEAATLRRAALVEKEFTPVVTLPGSGLLRGTEAGFPSLQGYVVTSVRTGAETVLLADEEQIDPLLAAWNIGVGRSVAFTSDLSSRWGRSWLGWDRLGPFVTQMVRSTVSQFNDETYPVRVTTDGLSMTVTMDAIRADGSPVTDLTVRGSALGKGQEPVAFEPRQDEAGVYTATVDIPEQGHYIVQLLHERDGERGRVVVPAAIDFAPEYRSLRSREEVLVEAARITGGGELGADDDPFEHDFAGVRGRVEVWPWALIAALLLLVADVAARRFDFALPRRLPRPKAKERPAKAAPRKKPTAGPVDHATPPDDGPPPARPERPASEATDVTLDQLKQAKDRAAKKREWK